MTCYQMIGCSLDTQQNFRLYWASALSYTKKKKIRVSENLLLVIFLVLFILSAPLII